MPLSFLLVMVTSLVLGNSFASAQGFIVCEGTSCSACDFVRMVNLIINWLITVLIMVFAVRMVFAGFGLVMSQGNSDAMTKAKEGMISSVIGLIIILSAWLIVDTLIRGLRVVDERGGPFPWSRVECQVQTRPESAVEPAGANELPGVARGGFSAGTGAGGMAGAVARERLVAAGVGIGNVISFEGVQPHALDTVIAMNRECNCNITVTEATGGTHSRSGEYRHDNGYKLDLRTRDNQALVNYVQTQFQSAGQWSNGTPVFQRDIGNTRVRCALERTHMDCQYIPRSE
jgi:hypothetical protein